MNPLERPFRPADLTETPVRSFDLHALAAQLVREPQYEAEGKAGLTLIRDAQVVLLLEALRKGSELREHRAPASAMVTLLSGRATFVSEAGAQRTELTPGTAVAFAAGLDHALLADEDSACLIVIGGRGERS